VIVIYHANCPDGFCGAWLLSKLYPQAHFLPYQYGCPPSIDLFTGRDLILVDFCFDRDSMNELIRRTKSILIFDHHKSVDPDLRSLPQFVFDEQECGASLVWKHYQKSLVEKFPASDINAFSGVHWLVEYVKDRDLWQWALPDSDAVNEGILLSKFDFDAWDQLMFYRCLNLGKVVVDFRQKVVDMAVKKAMMVEVPASETSAGPGHLVPCVNATQFISHIGEALAKTYTGSDFGMTYFHRINVFGKQEFVYSLRSANQFDVSEVAMRFGGGGHAAAAGFRRSEFFQPAVAWDSV
jgi:oligoribonuclease NrnB/cAMP/cGMP phosphodiesterase (DHH superfamily)